MQEHSSRYVSPEIGVIEIDKVDIVRTSPGTNNGADGYQPDGSWWD